MYDNSGTGPDAYELYEYTGNETPEQLEWVRHWLYQWTAKSLEKYAAPLPKWPESK